MPQQGGNISSNLGIYDYRVLEKELESKIKKKRIVRASLRFIYRSEAPARIIQNSVKDLSEELIKKHSYGGVKITNRQNSGCDKSSKLVFETSDGYLIEGVLIRNQKDHKTTLCLSSQVGCTEKCRFCATATMGFKRNLKASEILDQLYLSQKIAVDEGRKISHVVFMGMGEPLRNLEEVMKAIDVMLSPRGFQLSSNNISVSTLGLPKEMLKLTKKWPEIQLILSLHAANDDLRTEIMPINTRYKISELLKTIEEIETYRPGTVMISYLMFKGKNDGLDQVDQLANLFKERRVIFNLIPFNESDLVSSEFKSGEREHLYTFRSKLMEKGHLVTIRESFGKDIDAACGQLALR